MPVAAARATVPGVMRAAGHGAAAQPPRPFRDNPRLILVEHPPARRRAGRHAVLREPLDGRLSPDFLTEFVLYALSVADLTMLVALVFVLARNIVKLLVERRRALPFARFRAKLVALLLGMTLIPAVLVLLVGSELIRNSVDRWFNAPMDEMLSSANEIASDYYRERQRIVSDQAGRIARGSGAAGPGERPTSPACGAVVAPEVTSQRVAMVEVYRVAPAATPRPEVTFVVEVEAPGARVWPPGYNRAVRRSAGRARGGRDRRAARAGAARDRRRADPRRGAGSRAGRAPGRRRGRERLPDGGHGGPVAPHDARPTRTTRSCACSSGR